MNSEIITNMRADTIWGLKKEQIFDGIISIALITIAAMQLCGTLPSVIDHDIFTYGAIGLGFLKGLGTLYSATKNKRELTALITSIAIIALGITARFHLVGIKELSITMMAVGIFSTTLLFVTKKIFNDHMIRFRVGLKWIVDKTDREKYFNIFFTLVSLGTLALGVMKLTGFLPSYLDGTTLTYIALGVGGSSLLFAGYKMLVDTEKRHDISEELLAACALLTVGVLSYTHLLSNSDLGTAIVGIESAMFGIGFIHYLASKNLEVQKSLNGVEIEGRNKAIAQSPR